MKRAAEQGWRCGLKMLDRMAEKAQESEFRDLRRERDEELQRLEEDEQVVLDEPELINVAVVIGV